MMQSDFKNKAIFTMMVLFLAAAFLVITLPPKHINSDYKDVAPYATSKKPATSNTGLIKNLDTHNNEKEQSDYYIIVGTFKNLSLAQEMAGHLKKDSHTDIFILPPTAEGYYRISYGKYSTAEEAKAIIKSLSKTISSDAWVYSVNK
jgi:hypothetical protein